MKAAINLPGFHLGRCLPGRNDAPAGPGCQEDCPRRLHAEVERLQEEYRAALRESCDENRWNTIKESIWLACPADSEASHYQKALKRLRDGASHTCMNPPGVRDTCGPCLARVALDERKSDE